MPPSLPPELWDPPTCLPSGCSYSGKPIPANSPISPLLRTSFLEVFNQRVVAGLSFRIATATPTGSALAAGQLATRLILELLSSGTPPSALSSALRYDGRASIRRFLLDTLASPSGQHATVSLAISISAFQDALYLLAAAVPNETERSWGDDAHGFCLHDLVLPNAAGLSRLEAVKAQAEETVFKEPLNGTQERAGPQTALVDEVRARVSRRELQGAEWKKSSVWRAKVREAVGVAHEVYDEVVAELSRDSSIGGAFRRLFELVDPLALWTLASRDFQSVSKSRAVRSGRPADEFGNSGFVATIIRFCECRDAVEELERLSGEQKRKEKEEKDKARRLANAPKTNGTSSASTSTLPTPAEEAAAAAKKKDDTFDAMMARSEAVKRLAEIREEKALAETELEALRKRIGEMEKESVELEKVLAPPAPSPAPPPKKPTPTPAAGDSDDEMPGLIGESDDEGPPPPPPAPKKTRAPSSRPAPPKPKGAPTTVDSDDDGMPALVPISDDEGPKPAPTSKSAAKPPPAASKPAPASKAAPAPKPKPAALDSDDDMPGLVDASDDEFPPKPTRKTAPAPKAPTASTSTSNPLLQPSRLKPAPPQLSTSNSATPPTPQPKRAPVAVSDDDMPALVPISDDDEEPKPLFKSAKKKAAKKRAVATPSPQPMRRPSSNSDDMPPLVPISDDEAPKPAAKKQTPAQKKAATPSSSKAKPPAATTVDSDDEMPGLVGESDDDEWDDEDDESDGSTERGDSDPEELDLAAVDRTPTCNCLPGTHGAAPRTAKPLHSKPKSNVKPCSARATPSPPKIIPTLPTPVQRTLISPKPSALYSSLPRIVPPTCCPPDRCTKVQPHHSYSSQPGHLEFSALDAVLVDIFRTHVIMAMASENRARLEDLRGSVVANILSAVTKLDVADAATRKLIESNVDRALGEEICLPATQADWGHRALVVGLMTGLGYVSALGDSPESTCICQLSAGIDSLKKLSNELMAKNTAAQMELRNLTPVVPAQWENWATAEIKTGNLKGACWKDSKWQASLKKVVVSIERQFNEAVASVDDAFFVADYLETISWLGGVRVYEEVTRLSRDAAEAIPVEGAKDPNPPFKHWSDLVLLAGTAREENLPLRIVSADSIKIEGDQAFEKRHHSRSATSYAMASLMNPLSIHARTNAALARLKLASKNELQQAIADCTLAIYYDEKNYKAFYRRGQALVRLKKFDLAISDLEQALKLDLKNWAIKEELELARSRGVGKGKGKGKK